MKIHSVPKAWELLVRTNQNRLIFITIFQFKMCISCHKSTGLHVDEQISRVLQKTLPSLSKLQSLEWVMSCWGELHSTYSEKGHICHCFVVCKILSYVLQVLANQTDRSNSNLSSENNVYVLQPQVSGYSCSHSELFRSSVQHQYNSLWIEEWETKFGIKYVKRTPQYRITVKH